MAELIRKVTDLLVRKNKVVGPIVVEATETARQWHYYVDSLGSPSVKFKSAVKRVSRSINKVDGVLTPDGLAWSTDNPSHPELLKALGIDDNDNNGFQISSSPKRDTLDIFLRGYDIAKVATIFSYLQKVLGQTQDSLTVYVLGDPQIWETSTMAEYKGLAGVKRNS